MDSSSPIKPSLLDRLSALLSPEPDDRNDLLSHLRSACERQLIDADALSIIEGTLQMSDMQVCEIMVPRAQMDVIRLDDPIEKIAQFAVETGRSRFPAVSESKDDVVGIFLAKDLLRYFTGHQFEIRDMLRPAVFVPESKRLDVLLREFRTSRNHMAIVVDEYGGVAGLVTIEDVLEQIVGEIEDEFDFDESGDNIRRVSKGRFLVRAATEIEDFNAAMGTDWSAEDVDTVGGYLMWHLGRLPEQGEMLGLPGVKIRVLRADGRRVHVLLVEPLAPVDNAGAH